MESFVVFVFAGVVMLVLIAVARFLSRLDVRGLPATEVNLDTYDSVEGLELVASRAVYEAHQVEFMKEVEPFEVRVELCDGPGDHFTRVTIDFPLRLHLGIRLQAEFEDGFTNRMLQAREIEIGDEAFDTRFLVFGPDPERVVRAIEPEVRALLNELADDAGDVRLSDETLLVVYPQLLEAEKLTGVMEKMLEIAGRYTERGKAIYEQIREGESADERAGSGPLRSVGT